MDLFFTFWIIKLCFSARKIQFAVLFRMTFPALLNLNEFVYDATKSEPPKKISWATAVANPRFVFILISYDTICS